jgi:signal peptidase I
MKPQTSGTYKITGIIWVVSTLFFFLLFGFVTDWFRSSLNPKDLNTPNTILGTLVILFIISASSLFLTITDFLMHIFVNSPFHKNTPGVFPRIQNSIVFIFFVLLFPLFLFVMIFNPFKFVRTFFKPKPTVTPAQPQVSTSVKIAQILGVILILIPLWVGLYYVSGQAAYQAVRHRLGYYEDAIPLAGTGSMYPTFPKGEGKTPQELARETVGEANMLPYPNGIVLFGKRYYGHEIARGDIIDFQNKTTEEITTRNNGTATGFLKRVIGLPGDVLEIRDGLVYRNNEPLLEQYIAKARSTFGGDFLPDCQELTVPEGKLFVMGDNRKGSLDSRYELGLISYNDINHVIAYENQIGILDKNWRDTSKDLENSSKISLDKDRYVELVNKKRIESGLHPITYQPKLETSAAKRAKQILEDNELSKTNGLNGDAMEKSINEIGYVHYQKAELPRQGHYEAEELFENQFEFPVSKNFLISKEYQEIGIAEVESDVNGCPTQIIVQHLAGYVPPNYKKEDIQSWKDVLQRLKDVQPGWEKLRTTQDFYNQNKSDIDRINEIIVIRIARIQSLVVRFEANQWLTNQENTYVDEDFALANEQQTIGARLNAKSQQ